MDKQANIKILILKLLKTILLQKSLINNNKNMTTVRNIDTLVSYLPITPTNPLSNKSSYQGFIST